MIIDFSYYTYRGKVRQKNEDSIFAAADGDLGIFAVADGMGGHYGGEIAGSRLTAALKDRWDSFLLSETDFEMAKEGLKETVSLVNGQLYAEYAAKGRMCGTTAAILFVYGNKYAAINSGDSRIYSCHSMRLRQESMDQTAGNLFSETDEKSSGKLISAVGCHADKLDITLLTEDELTPEDVQIEISAKLQFNLLRAAFFAVCLFTVYILFFAGKDVYAFLKKKPEWFFAIFTLMLGGLIIEGLGSNMVGYDEYVHAKSAYKLSFGSTIETTEAAMQMVGNNLPYFNNPEERELVEAYEDKVNDPDYIAPDIGHQSRLPRTETRVYYPMAAGFYLGRVLHTGFVDMMELARLGNLLCYIFIVFWAVKKAKGYQMVVAAIGMFPNNVFIASSLSYDMLVNAGLLLGYVLLLNEILTPDEKIKPSNAFFMLFSFMAGCLSKPVYIVMSLMLLFLPKKKFQNRVSEIVFKAALLFLNGLMIYNIFFPTPVSGGDYALVSNSAYAGDKRSIGTSTVGQLQFVMSNPLQYAVILLRSMFDMLMDYTVKGNPFVSYGYMGAAGYLANWLMIALGLFAALFANVKTSIRKEWGH